MSWDTLQLGEVCEFKNGFAFKSKTFKGSGVPVVRITNIKNEKVDINDCVFVDLEDYNKDLSSFIVRKGDLLIAMSGATTGKIGVYSLEKTSLLNQRVGKFIPSKKLSTRFLFFFLLRKVEDNLSISAGSAQPNLSTEQIRKFSIPVPPLSEQKQIVETLDIAFEKIDKAIANIERNIQNAEEYLGNSIVELFVKSNWKKYDWGDVCNFTRGPFGGSLKKSMFKESGYAVYEQKQAIHNDYKSLRYFIDEGKFKEMERFQVSTGDLLMSCSGVTLGRVSEVPEDAPNGIINQALLRLRTNKNMILNEFVKIWIESRIFQKLIFEYSGGAAQPNVPGVKILKKIKIPCPKIDEQKSFINKYKNISSNISNYNKKQNNKLISLKELKKSILEKAFKGELTSAA